MGVEDLKEVGSVNGIVPWILYSGKSTSTGSSVSVFEFNQMTNPPYLEMATNYIAKLKMVRHPSIIPFENDICEDHRVVFLTSEKLVPLRSLLEEESLSSWEVIWGIYCILSGLQFIHGSLEMLHGGITVDSIFVNESGDWKLGGLELTSSFSSERSYFMSHESYLDHVFRSQERLGGDWSSVEGRVAGSMDMFSLGVVIDHLLHSHPLSSSPPDSLGNLRAFVDRTQRENPRQRPTTKQFFKCTLFKMDEVVEILCHVAAPLVLTGDPNDLENLNMLCNKVQDQIGSIAPPQISSKIIPFFSSSLQQMILLPNNPPSQNISHNQSKSREENGISPKDEINTTTSIVISKRDLCISILSLLSSAVVALEGSERSLQLLACNETTSPAPLSQSLSQAMSYPDRAVRIHFLEHLKVFLPVMVTTPDEVLEVVLNGTSDSSSQVKLASLKAIPTAVFITNEEGEIELRVPQNALDVKVMRTVLRLTGDEEHSIRANLPILLAKLSPLLSPSAHAKAVPQILNKSVNDPFIPTRVSAVRSCVAIARGEKVTSSQIACHFLPLLSPKLIDSSSDVRDQARSAIDSLLDLVKEKFEEENCNEETKG